MEGGERRREGGKSDKLFRTSWQNEAGQGQFSSSAAEAMEEGKRRRKPIWQKNPRKKRGKKECVNRGEDYIRRKS
jgi:hypothetical protein